jgi:hypothetical protein
MNWSDMFLFAGRFGDGEEHANLLRQPNKRIEYKCQHDVVRGPQDSNTSEHGTHSSY